METKRARIKWVENLQFIGNAPSGHSILMDGPPEVGGDNVAIRPGEMTLVALGGLWIASGWRAALRWSWMPLVLILAGAFWTPKGIKATQGQIYETESAYNYIQVIEKDGWFHTGDIGFKDDDGFLVITDRKKELIVNAYGKNIAPAPIENSLKSSRWIAQAVVVGARRQFLSALLVPDFETLRPWAAAQGITGSNEELVAHPAVRAAVAADVAKTNEHLARYEQVRNWELLPAEFTLEGGELTPTLKVKRRVVERNYAAQIEDLYQE